MRAGTVALAWPAGECLLCETGVPLTDPSADA